MAEQRRRHFAALEGVRGLAAIAVVVFHFSSERQWNEDYELVGRTIGRLGNLGVCVFFLLSGFVLYRPRVATTLAGKRQEPLTRYVPFRLLRILPAYWLALGFLLFAFWHRNPYDLPDPDAIGWVEHLRFFGLLQVYDTTYVIRGLGVAWTLAIELVFYLALPMIAWAIAQASGSVRDVDAFKRRQMAGVLIFGLLGLTSRIILLGSADHRAAGVAWPISYLDWFALGMALAVMTVGSPSNGRLSKLVRGVLGRTVPSWSLAAALFALSALVLPPQVFGEFGTIDLHVRFLANGLIAFLFLGPLVLGASTSTTRRLESKPMQSLGKVSYGIYLWHLIWILAIQTWVEQGLLGGGWVTEAVLLAILTLGSSTVSFVAAEQPMLDWKARLRERDRRSAAIEAPIDANTRQEAVPEKDSSLASAVTSS